MAFIKDRVGVSANVQQMKQCAILLVVPTQYNIQRKITNLANIHN